MEYDEARLNPFLMKTNMKPQDAAPQTAPPIKPLPPLKEWEGRLLETLAHAERAYRETLRSVAGMKIDSFPTAHGLLRSLRFEPRDPSRIARSPMYFIHGYNALASQWVPQGRALGQDRRIHAPDLLGHGLSDDPREEQDFSQALDGSLNEHFLGTLPHHDPGVVIGNSLGGWLAIRLALAFPERVKALVLISPAGAPLSDEEYTQFVSGFRFEDARQASTFFAKLHGRSHARTQGGLRGIVAEAKHQALGLAAGPVVRALFRRRWIEALPRSISSAHFLSPAELQQLQMPILFIWGKREAIMLPQMREWYRSHLPAHAEFLEPDEFGHCPQLDRPDDLNRLIQAFDERIST